MSECLTYRKNGFAVRSKDFADKVIKECLDGLTVKQASVKYEVPPTTISSWFKRSGIKPPFHYQEEKIDGETWVPIKGYEGYYEISSHQRVRSLSRESNFFKGRIVKSHKWQNGYRFHVLYKDGVSQQYSVHRLVAIQFVSNPNNDNEVNHKNGIKEDNRPENLEWVTKSENVRHAYSNGLINHGKLGDNAKSKKVGRFDGDILIKEYSCARDAEKDGFWASNIWLALHTEGRKHKGFTWKYL